MIVSVLFTKNGGDPATGLTLSDIEVTLKARNRETGALTTIWSAVHPTEEVGGGQYTRKYADENTEVYTYHAWAQYTGGVSLDSDYALQAGASSVPAYAIADEVVDALSGASVEIAATVVGDTITVYNYTTWEFTLENLPDLSDAAANGVLFTVKARESAADSSAMLQVQEGVGLLYINGAAGEAAKATLTVGGTEDSITVSVVADQTGVDMVRDLYWDIKKIITTITDADVVARGRMDILQSVTQDTTV